MNRQERIQNHLTYIFLMRRAFGGRQNNKRTVLAVLQGSHFFSLCNGRGFNAYFV